MKCNMNTGAVTEEDFEKSFEDVPTVSVIVVVVFSCHIICQYVITDKAGHFIVSVVLYFMNYLVLIFACADCFCIFGYCTVISCISALFFNYLQEFVTGVVKL